MVRASFESEQRERQLDEIITLLPPATNLKDFAPDSFHNDANQERVHSFPVRELFHRFMNGVDLVSRLGTFSV